MGWLRSHYVARGITISGQSHVVSLYADNLLLYMKRPLSTFPELLEDVERFGLVSGLRINWEKSVLYPVKKLSTGTLQVLPLFPVRWEFDVFRYIGIQVSASPAEVLQYNVTKRLDSIQSSIFFWT